MATLMEAWLSNDALLSLFILSVISFIGSLIAIPFLLIRLPPDYFDQRYPRTWMQAHHPLLRVSGLVLKNLAGIVFLFAGFLMLFLPGQGVLTMVIGLSLMDFPGKRALERKLVGQPAVLRTINKLREKFNRPPLTVTTESSMAAGPSPAP
jgi:hypothetical protein